MMVVVVVVVMMMMMLIIRICGEGNMVGRTQHEGGSEVTQESAGQIESMMMMMRRRRRRRGVWMMMRRLLRIQRVMADSFHSINCQVQY